jgi:hypothetical protein
MIRPALFRILVCFSVDLSRWHSSNAGRETQRRFLNAGANIILDTLLVTGVVCPMPSLQAHDTQSEASRTINFVPAAENSRVQNVARRQFKDLRPR